MAVQKTMKDFVISGDGEAYLPSLSLDCVIFGFHENQLKVLLLKIKNAREWALPGGFILKNEDVDEAAKRVLKERTGLTEIFLQQFNVFGKPKRSDANFHRKLLKKDGIKIKDDHWLLRRFVTVGYYALVEYSYVTPRPDTFSDECTWQDIDDLPHLMMDHRQILDKALETLRSHLNYHPVGYNFLPEKFTMPQLQKLYETILDKKLDRRNFQRKILSYGILKRLKEVKQGVAHKAPYLYSFNLQKYHKALKEGLQGGW
ncbi:MAG TPA: NUDIX domain-containing protein [Chitinophagaceae bacterium]|nr:NUDIX domain-containing protein [Chitinophagaceae bacterium]